LASKHLSELKSIWKRQQLNWKTVVVRQVFNRFFNEMTLQYTHIYIRELGASPVELGTVNSVSGISGTLVSLPLGYIQDRFSVRKVFLLGVAILTLAPFFYAVANRWEMVIPAILLSGLEMRLGACVVICDLCLPNVDRATGKAICEGIGAIPRLFAPMIAASLVTVFGGLKVEGIRPLFWIQFATRVILLVYLTLKMTEIIRRRRTVRRFDLIGDFREVFKRGTAVKRWLLFQSLNIFTSGMMVPFRYPFAKEIKGAGPFVIGGITTAMILTEAAFSIPLGRYADRMGRKRLFYLLTPFFSLSNIVFILAPSSQWLLVSGLLYGFRMLSFYAYGSMTPELVPRDCIGRWRGLIGLCTGIASIPAPIIGGLIWENLGPSWVFMVATLVDLLIRLPLLITVPETLKKTKSESVR
jgi:MFS family permease